MRLLRRVFLVAFIACFAYVVEACDSSALDAMTVKETKVKWFLASNQTLARQWMAAVIANTPHSRCVVGHESLYAGLYHAYDGSGNYGAYQFSQETWDSVNARHGRPDLVGVAPLEPRVPSWDQDIAAGWLYAERGDQPWGSRCGGM